MSLYKLGGLNIRTVLHDKGQLDGEAMTHGTGAERRIRTTRRGTANE